MAINNKSDLQKTEKQKRFEESFKEMSFKEKLMNFYIPLSFVVIILTNGEYIVRSIINNEEISLSTIRNLTIISLVVPTLLFTFAILYYRRMNEIIAEKILHKYGISEFTLGAMIMIFFVVIAVVITPIFTDEAPLSIAQIVFVILFGILCMFILKNYVFKSK